MPQAIPIAAAAIAKVAVAVGVPAAIAKTAAVFAVKFAVSTALSTAVGLLTAPKVDAAGSPVDWTSDPNAPIPILFGEMETGGNIVRRKAFGDENMYQGVIGVISAGGPIESIGAVLVENATITFNPTTQQANSPYGDKLWFSSQLGEQPEASWLQSPSGLRGGVDWPGWTSSHKLSGKAAYMATFGHDSKGKIWKRGDLPKFRIRCQGQLCHDPRLDSTFTGGSGSHRPDDASTWEYTTNGALAALKWARGIWEGANGGVPHSGDTLVAGMGLRDEKIDVASFVAGANLADALGWEITARPTTDDDKWEVLKALLQAAGCAPVHIDGVLTCVQVAASKSSVATLERGDIIGSIRFARSPSRLERHNAAYPRYRSPAHNYDMVTADIVDRAEYLTEDGGVTRSREVQLPYVPDVEQASSLTAYWIADGREGFVGGMQVKPHLRGVMPGQCFTMPTTDDLGPISGQKLYLLSRKFDTQTGVLTWGFRAETDEKHTWAGGVTGTIEDPLTPDDPPDELAAPDPSEWTLTAGSLGSAAELPALFLDGAVDNPLASGVFVEYRRSGLSPEDPWAFLAEGDPNDTHYQTTNVAPGTGYEVSIRYRDGRNGTLSTNRLVLGPETTGGIVIDWPDQNPPDPTVTDGWDLLRGTSGGSINASPAEAADAVDRANLGLESDGTVAAAKVETASVAQGAITPAYEAFTAGAVSWVSSGAEQDLQSVSVTVTRGEVVITAMADVGTPPTIASGWYGRFRLYRGATEIPDAERRPRTIPLPGGGYDLPSQLVLTYLDDPGPGTYTYKVTFTPGGTMTGDLARRSLICDVKEG